jgi:hypothetical protein
MEPGDLENDSKHSAKPVRREFARKYWSPVQLRARIPWHNRTDYKPQRELWLPTLVVIGVTLVNLSIWKCYNNELEGASRKCQHEEDTMEAIVAQTINASLRLHQLQNDNFHFEGMNHTHLSHSRDFMPLLQDHDTIMLTETPAFGYHNKSTEETVSTVQSDSRDPPTTTSFLRHEPRPISLFYNIFVPDDVATGGARTRQAYRIVSEQLRQVAESFVGGYSALGNVSNTTRRRSVRINYLCHYWADESPS